MVKMNYFWFMVIVMCIPALVGSAFITIDWYFDHLKRKEKLYYQKLDYLDRIDIILSKKKGV